MFNDCCDKLKSFAGVSGTAPQKLWWVLKSLRQCNVSNQPSRASQGPHSLQLLHVTEGAGAETLLHFPELCSSCPSHSNESEQLPNKKTTYINLCKDLATAFLICHKYSGDAGTEGDEKGKGHLQFVGGIYSVKSPATHESTWKQALVLTC